MNRRTTNARQVCEMVNLHRVLGVHATSAPSPSTTAHQSHDIDVYPFGQDYGALVSEVKAYGDDTGLETLARELGENDLLFLMRDQQEPLVVLPWRVWRLILERLPR